MNLKDQGKQQHKMQITYKRSVKGRAGFWTNKKLIYYWHNWSPKKRRRPKSIESETKIRSTNRCQRNKENHQKLLQSSVCQQLGNAEEMDTFLNTIYQYWVMKPSLVTESQFSLTPYYSPPKSLHSTTGLVEANLKILYKGIHLQLLTPTPTHSLPKI